MLAARSVQAAANDTFRRQVLDVFADMAADADLAARVLDRRDRLCSRFQTVEDPALITTISVFEDTSVEAINEVLKREQAARALVSLMAGGFEPRVLDCGAAEPLVAPDAAGNAGTPAASKARAARPAPLVVGGGQRRTTKTIGEWSKRCRRIAGSQRGKRLTQAEVAERAGLTQTDMTLLEQDKSSPSPSTVRLLARIYGVQKPSLLNVRAGEIMTAALASTGLTDEQITAKTKFAIETLASWRTGRHQPTPNNQALLIQALGLPLRVFRKL